MSDYYGDVQDVISYSRVQPEMLGLTTRLELELLIEKWLEQVTEFINQDRNRDYREGATVPKGIHNIAMRMVATLIRNAQRQATGSVVQIDGRDLIIDDASIFSTDILKDLRRYPRKPRFGMMVLPPKDDGV